MSTFDVNAFLGSEITGQSETRYTPIPEGDNYLAVVSGLKGDNVNGDPVLRIELSIDDEKAREVSGMAEPKVEATLWLDIENGGLAFGPNKNVQLGRLREAVGQNDPAKPWSPKMLEGQVCKVAIKHRVNDNGDRFAKVAGFAPRG